MKRSHQRKARKLREDNEAFTIRRTTTTPPPPPPPPPTTNNNNNKNNNNNNNSNNNNRGHFGSSHFGSWTCMHMDGPGVPAFLRDEVVQGHNNDGSKSSRELSVATVRDRNPPVRYNRRQRRYRYDFQTIVTNNP